jgi:uncharacterized membrane protein (DUF2068 family)
MGTPDIRYRIAAVLMLAHGALMELGVFVALIPLLALDVDFGTVGRYFSFNVPFFQEHLVEMMVLSGVFGVTRIIGAIGVLRNRLWGLVLSVINCAVTMVLMVFMLPAGIVDGLLACSALILLLTAHFGTRPLSQPAR